MNQKAADAMKVLLKECNTMGKSEVGETIANELMREHRTIQQNFMRELYKALCLYSASSHDLRNEASVNFANEAKDLNHYFPFV